MCLKQHTLPYCASALTQHATHAVQEVQLFTADVDHKIMTMGLRTSACEVGTSKADSSSPLQQTYRATAPMVKSSSHSPEQDNNNNVNHLSSPTHCSTSNLLSQGLLQGSSSRSSSAAAARTLSRVREVTADSEEIKEEPGTSSGMDSPQCSSPKYAVAQFLGSGRLSSSQQSPELQVHARPEDIL